MDCFLYINTFISFILWVHCKTNTTMRSTAGKQMNIKHASIHHADDNGKN